MFRVLTVHFLEVDGDTEQEVPLEKRRAFQRELGKTQERLTRAARVPGAGGRRRDGHRRMRKMESEDLDGQTSMQIHFRTLFLPHGFLIKDNPAPAPLQLPHS